jgi:hypothetical protein
MEIMTELTEDELVAVAGGVGSATVTVAAGASSVLFDAFVAGDVSVSTTPSAAQANAAALTLGDVSSFSSTSACASVS